MLLAAPTYRRVPASEAVSAFSYERDVTEQLRLAIGARVATGVATDDMGALWRVGTSGTLAKDGVAPYATQIPMTDCITLGGTACFARRSDSRMGGTPVANIAGPTILAIEACVFKPRRPESAPRLSRSRVRSRVLSSGFTDAIAQLGRLMSRRVALLVLLLMLVAGCLGAQPVELERDRGTLLGVSFGVPGSGGRAEPELFTIGVQFTQLRMSSLGADISIGTMPRTFAEGFAVVGLRAGLAFPVAPVRNTLLIPSGGLSMVAAANAGGAGGFGGLNAGIATVILSHGSAGLRAGITWHHFPDARRAIWLAELGIAHLSVASP